MEKKAANEMYASFFEFTNKARIQLLEAQNCNVPEVLKVERNILAELKRQTASMMEMCQDEATRNARILNTMENQASDWRCGSTRPAQQKRHVTPIVVTGPEGGLPTLGGESTVGSVTSWDHVTTLEQCTDSQTEVVVIPSDPDTASQATYIGPCRAQGMAEITGSGICTVTMEHSFDFMAADAKKYKFTPEFFINGIISLSGQGDFQNRASIVLGVNAGDVGRGHQTIFSKNNRDLWVDTFRVSFPPTTGPSATANLDTQETINITVSCVLHVEAKELAYALIDLHSSENLYYAAPYLRVSRERYTVPLVEREQGHEVMDEILLIEDVELPPIPPLKGFRFGG